MYNYYLQCVLSQKTSMISILIQYVDISRIEIFCLMVSCRCFSNYNHYNNKKLKAEMRNCYVPKITEKKSFLIPNKLSGLNF